MPDGRVTVLAWTQRKRSSFGSQRRCRRARWNLGMRLLESLEGKDVGPEQAAADPRPGQQE